MAKKNASETENGADPSASPKSSFPIIPLLNTIAILATSGLIYYSKMVFKRPRITEESERTRLMESNALPTPATDPGFIQFDPVTVNIEAVPHHPAPADGTSQQLHGKLHFVTVGFSLAVRDRSQADLINEVRPQILDKLIATLGKKKFTELNNVQGRYVLHSQIMDFANDLLVRHSAKPMKDGLVTNVYFTQFVVQ